MVQGVRGAVAQRESHASRIGVEVGTLMTNSSRSLWRKMNRTRSGPIVPVRTSPEASSVCFRRPDCRNVPS
jgi:hypothetical protein